MEVGTGGKGVTVVVVAGATVVVELLVVELLFQLAEYLRLQINKLSVSSFNLSLFAGGTTSFIEVLV